MTYSPLALPFINRKVIPSKRLRGLISEMIVESGQGQETSSVVNDLLKRIDHPSTDFINLELTRLDNGWAVSEIDLRHYYAGAPSTRRRSDS